jgi:integrase
MRDSVSAKGLSDRDVKRLLDTAKREIDRERGLARRRSDFDKTLRDYAMVVLALNAGLRPSEIAGLTVGDLHCGAPSSYVQVRTRAGRPGAGERVERVDLRSQVALAVLDWTVKLESRSSPMFPSERMTSDGRRRPMSTRGVFDAIKRLLNKAGLGEFSVEDLRSYFLRREIETQAQAGQIDIELIARRARHKTLAQAAKLVAAYRQASIHDHMRNRPLDL